jgi:hypothetical protein
MRYILLILLLQCGCEMSANINSRPTSTPISNANLNPCFFTEIVSNREVNQRIVYYTERGMTVDIQPAGVYNARLILKCEESTNTNK